MGALRPALEGGRSPREARARRRVRNRPLRRGPRGARVARLGSGRLGGDGRPCPRTRCERQARQGRGAAVQGGLVRPGGCGPRDPRARPAAGVRRARPGACGRRAARDRHLRPCAVRRLLPQCVFPIARRDRPGEVSDTRGPGGGAPGSRLLVPDDPAPPARGSKPGLGSRADSRPLHLDAAAARRGRVRRRACDGRSASCRPRSRRSNTCSRSSPSEGASRPASRRAWRASSCSVSSSADRGRPSPSA